MGIRYPCILWKAPPHLLNKSITTYLFCVCVRERTLKFYFLSKFQLHNKVSSTTDVMFYISSLGFVHLIAENSNPFTNLSLFPLPHAHPSSWQPLFWALFLQVWLFSFLFFLIPRIIPCSICLCPSLSGLFHVAKHPQGSLMSLKLWHMAGLLLSQGWMILHSVCTPSSLFPHPLMDA